MLNFVKAKILFIAVIMIILVISCENKENAVQVCFSDTCVDVEVVDTPSQRARGLMYRESLAENEGMLFVFEKSDKYSFWMKNTYIPLDIIWIDEEKVVHIEHALPCTKDPCISYKTDRAAKYVLEVNAGFVEKNGVVVGDEVGIVDG